MADIVILKKKSYCDDQDNNFETKSMTSSHTTKTETHKNCLRTVARQDTEFQDLASLRHHDSSHESSRLLADVQRYPRAFLEPHLFVRRCLSPFGRPFDQLLLLQATIEKIFNIRTAARLCHHHHHHQHTRSTPRDFITMARARRAVSFQ